MDKIFNLGFIIGGLIAIVFVVNIVCVDNPIYPLLVVPVFVWVIFTIIGYHQVKDYEASKRGSRR